MSEANNRQVGGDHYKSEYQPWDFIIDLQIGYLEGNAIKYISRWRTKNGIEDLEKAKHYVTKLKECFTKIDPPDVSHITLESGIQKFIGVNKLTPQEGYIIGLIVGWPYSRIAPQSLDLALSGIDELIKEAS